MSTWAAGTLSFAARLLLIKSVISGITHFWCSSFILPKSIIKTINSLCNSFLWSGQIDQRYTARVSWAAVTKPKSEGGLGIKDLVTWNLASTIKMVWLLFFRSGSLWVGWFKHQILSGKLNNFWKVKEKQSHPWLINKLIRIRDIAYNWIKIGVGNGENTYFWTDNWSPLGSLNKAFAGDQAFRRSIPTNATLRDLSVNGNWVLPSARSELQVSVHAFISTISLSTNQDTYIWAPNNVPTRNFSTGQVYSLLGDENVQVPWVNTVWNSGGIPRHSFMVWQVTLDRIPTRARLRSWGIQVDPICLLCQAANEDRNHLYFDCSYSWSIWQNTGSRCCLSPTRSWTSTIELMQQLRGNKNHRRVVLLAWQATIYLIWGERNGRLHRNIFRSHDAVLSILDRTIRNRISGFRKDNPSKSSGML